MTTQNNNEFLEGESNSRENFENIWKYPSEITKIGISYPAYEGFKSKIYIQDDSTDIKWIDFEELKNFLEFKKKLENGR